MPKAHANAGFEDEPHAGQQSGGPSPMGSNIFIVKPEGGNGNRSHPEPERHEPVTKKSFGRIILGGIRCE